MNKYYCTNFKLSNEQVYLLFYYADYVCYVLPRDVKFVFLPNSNFVLKFKFYSNFVWAYGRVSLF